MRTYSFQTRTVLLGTSAADNWALLSVADRDDWWVHLADHPSAHVILQDSLVPSREELVFAKELILGQTKKAPASAGLVYAQVRHIKRGSTPGEVIIKPRTEKYF